MAAGVLLLALHTMKDLFGLLGIVAVATVAVSDKNVVGAVAGAPAEKVSEDSREAHYLLQKHNEEVIGQLETLITAALATARSKEEQDSEDSKSLVLKLEVAMQQVEEVVQNGRQYATREEELLSKAETVRMAMASNREMSREFLKDVSQYAEAQLRAEEAGRIFLRSVGVLVQSVVSEEISRAFKEEDRGVEVLQRVSEAAQDVTRRVGEDSRRRFEELGQSLKTLVVILKRYVH